MAVVLRLLVGAAGGFAGGALVGLAEATVVASGGGLEEYWLFGFGSVSYGLFGAGLGLGLAVASSLFRIAKEDATLFGTSCGFVAASLGLVVARFRVARDLFGEKLALASTTGILVHLALLLAAAVVFLVVMRVSRRSACRRGAARASTRWVIGLPALGFLIALGLGTMAGGSTQAAVQEKSTTSGPNVLLIIADTLRADHVGTYGAKDVRTPAIDSLAADSVVFEHAFSQASWTRPSIATILTSLYPSSHKVMQKTDLLSNDVTTLAEAMQNAGYRTAGFVTNINIAPSFNFQQGFDSYTYLAPDFFFGATDSGSKLSLYSGMRLIRERFLSNRKYVDHYYQDAATVNSVALPWLQGRAATPFFALIHYMDPHDPYFELPYDGVAVARVETPVPKPGQAQELRRLYVSNVEYLDRFLAGVFAQLKKQGIYDQTIIAFVADHGEEFYEHQGWWHGTTLYEEQIHIPLIVKLAGHRQAGRRESKLARLLDVMPTLLGLAHVAVPDACQGRNLFGDTAAPTAVYAEEDHEGNVLESIRTDTWKLIVANEDNPRGLQPVALYNLAEDPGEIHNLAGSESAKVTALEHELRSLHAAAAARAVKGVSGDIDAASRERLRALGYVQ